jgi:cholesterol oxidase
MSMWPNKGEADPRPPLGEGYVRVEPVAPRAPVVPAGAFGALPTGPVGAGGEQPPLSGADAREPAPPGVEH